MQEYLNFYIDGQWVAPVVAETLDVINPATEQACAVISVGSVADVDKAVTAAQTAFQHYSQSTPGQREELLNEIVTVYKKRYADVADAITEEMGAPKTLAHGDQAGSGLGHLESTLATIKHFQFEQQIGKSKICYEPIGVCGMITPWNWPINQILSKVAPALAAGCTMVLKPSEVAPISAVVFTEIMDEAGVPAGVFNMVNGLGLSVGEAMSAHPGIDMMSFTGSTRGGIAVAKASADSVKRVSQELGGKSANIILDDADFTEAVENGVEFVMANSGQSCDAPTRMLVPAGRMQQAIEIARAKAQSLSVGDPTNEDVAVGPVVSDLQFEKIQTLIQAGIDEQATLVTGGTGRPEGLAQGYYVKPTIFGHVNNEMTIAREEIFGPVLTIIAFENEDDAIKIANDTNYGLAAYVSSQSKRHALDIAKQLRAGQVTINYNLASQQAPFGGYKQSGNGREQGSWGLHEFLEVKAITGSE